MEKKRIAAYAITIGLLLLFFVSLLLGPAKVIQPSPVRRNLPRNVGPYQGDSLLYCQNDQCLKVFTGAALGSNHVCSACHGVLDRMALGEKNLLPADTQILKRQYRQEGAVPMMVSVVVGGKERRSIHDPRRCIVAQGSRIVDQRLIRIPLQGRETLDVMLMETLPAARRENAAHGGLARSYYAYWFVSSDSETAHGYQRILRSIWRAVFHNLQMRWAYIAIAIPPQGKDVSIEDMLSDFIGRFYPGILVDSRNVGFTDQ